MSKKSSEILDVNDIVEKVEKLPQAEREVVFEKLEIYKGDLPHPETLKGYNSLYPEAAKKLSIMASLRANIEEKWKTSILKTIVSPTGLVKFLALS